MAFVNSDSANASDNVGNISFDISGLTAGNLIVLAITDDNSDASQTPTVSNSLALQGSGYGPVGPDNQCIFIYAKTLTAGDISGGTLTIAPHANSDWKNVTAGYVTLSGRAGTLTLGTSDSDSGSNSGTVTVDYVSITPAAGSDLIAVSFTDNLGFDAKTYGTLTGFDTRVNDANAGWANVYMGTDENVAAGATGALTQTYSGSGDSGWFSLLIEAPASGPSGITGDAAETLEGLTFAATGTLAAVDSITLTDQTNHKIFQRSGTTADIVFSGTNTGETPDHVQVQLYEADGSTVAQAWTTLTSDTIDASSFTGTLSTPEADHMYRFAVRSRNSSNTVLATSSVSTNLWSVGDNLAFAGDSDVYRIHSGDSESGITPSTIVRRLSFANEAWEAAGSDGIALNIAATHSANEGVAVGIIELGKSGAGAEFSGTPANAEYQKLEDVLQSAGTGAAICFATYGANDATGGLSNLTTYKGWLNTILSLIRTNLGANLPVVAITPSRFDGSSLDSEFDIARQGWQEISEEDADTYSYLSLLDLEMSSFHYTSAAYQTYVEPRIEAWNEFILGGGSDPRGPRITSLQVTGTTGTATVVNNGTALTINGTNNGLSAEDGSGSLSISSVTSPDANTLTITFGATPSGTVLLSYARGAEPHLVGQGINDNTTLALPMEPLYDLEATTGIVGEATETLEGMSFTVEGSIQITATATETLEGLSFDATGSAGVTGDASETLEGLSFGTDGTLGITAAAAIVLEDISFGAEGSLTIQGEVTETLEGLVFTASSGSTLQGVATETLEGLTFGAEGSLGNDGVATETLEGLTFGSTGSLEITGDASETLEGITFGSTSTLGITGEVTETLEGITFEAEIERTGLRTAEVSITLEGLAFEATGSLQLNANAGTVLTGLSSTMTGKFLFAGLNPDASTIVVAPETRELAISAEQRFVVVPRRNDSI